MLLCLSLVWPTKFANTLSFMQNWFDDWKFLEIVRNFIFGKIGLQFLFLKIISSHTHVFCSSISMLWVIPKYFSKTVFFLKILVSLCLFRLIRSVFSTNRNYFEIVLKFFNEPLCVSINRNSWIRFKKKIRFDLFKPLFQNFFLSLRLSKAPQQFFCRFPPNLLQGFSLPKPVCLFYPSFCIVFHVSCIFSWVLGTIFRLCIFWDFWWIKPCFVKLINGFCCHNDIFLIYDG